MKKVAQTGLFALIFLLISHSLAQANPPPVITDFLPPTAVDQLSSLEPTLLEALTKWLTARNEELNTILKNLVELEVLEEHLAWEDNDDLVVNAQNDAEALFRRIELKTYVLTKMLDGSDEP